MQISCLAYFVFLTLLLLSEQPDCYVPVSGGVLALLAWASEYAHLLSFLLLSVLVLRSRWPWPRWKLVAIMIAYGGVSELIQGLVPHRTPDWMDWFQDVAGVMLGLAACWVASRAASRWLRLRGGAVPAVGEES